MIAIHDVCTTAFTLAILVSLLACQGPEGPPCRSSAGCVLYTQEIPPGDARCPNGGVLLERGNDHDDDGMVDENLVTHQICHGAPGQDATGNHNHDDDYAAIDHDHDDTYAAADHTHPGTAKAWLTFDGKTMEVHDSFNVISVTRVNTGVYRVVWETPFADRSYVVVGSCNMRGSNGAKFGLEGNNIPGDAYEAFFATSVDVGCREAQNLKVDTDLVHVMAF